MGVDITSVEYSDWVLGKINQKHGYTVDDVFDAIENYDTAVWNEDPEHGRRLLVRGQDSSGRTLRVVLFPVDEESGTFRLGTAL